MRPFIQKFIFLLLILGALAFFGDRAFWMDMCLSLKRMVIGYTWVILIGVMGGLILGRVQWLYDFFGGLIVASQSMPGIVWVPLATYFFGLTETAVIFTIILGGTGIVLLNTNSGVRNVSPIFIQAAKVMGAKDLRLFWHVIVPAATPKIIDGLRLAWAFGWRALMAGELILSIGGFGRRIYDVVHSRDMLELSVLIGAIGVIGYGVDELIFKNLEQNVQKRWGLHAQNT
jgi:NitT/TauT family transport system permease protein